MKKFLWILNIIGFLMIFGAMCFLGPNKVVSDSLFWCGLLCALPKWIYDAKTGDKSKAITLIISIAIIIGIGLMYFCGNTINIPGKEPITIVTDSID